MTAQIIQFQTVVDVTDWTAAEIRDYMKRHGWQGFRFDSEAYQRTGQVLLRRERNLSAKQRRGR